MVVCETWQLFCSPSAFLTRRQVSLCSWACCGRDWTGLNACCQKLPLKPLHGGVGGSWVCVSSGDLGLLGVIASLPSEITGMIWVSVMDRAVCVQISNDLLHPFQVVAVKSISVPHTTTVYRVTCGLCFHSTAPPSPHSRWEYGGGATKHIQGGVSFFELHCINREIPYLSKLARTGVQRDLPGKAVYPDRNV